MGHPFFYAFRHPRPRRDVACYVSNANVLELGVRYGIGFRSGFIVERRSMLRLYGLRCGINFRLVMILNNINLLFN